MKLMELVTEHMREKCIWCKAINNKIVKWWVDLGCHLFILAIYSMASAGLGAYIFNIATK